MKEKMRRPYRKPEIHQVKLDLEEAVLTACKTGPGGLYTGGPYINTKCDHKNGCLETDWGS